MKGIYRESSVQDEVLLTMLSILVPSPSPLTAHDIMVGCHNQLRLLLKEKREERMELCFCRSTSRNALILNEHALRSNWHGARNGNTL